LARIPAVLARSLFKHAAVGETFRRHALDAEAMFEYRAASLRSISGIRSGVKWPITIVNDKTKTS
jgi:hypothetical protein